MATDVIKSTFEDKYRDDYRDSDNYYKILFNNGRPLQQRELNQMQTIIGKNVQIGGDFVLKNGARATGGEHRINREAQFIKLQASTTLPTNLTDLEQVVLTETGTDIKVEIIKAIDAEGSDPPTLYVVYIDGNESGTTDGTSIRTVSPDGVLTGDYIDSTDGLTAISYSVQEAAISSTANPATGKGCVFTVETGRYYIDGNFVFSENQSIVLDKYATQPNASVGFRVNEQIITSNDDQNLFDNSGVNLNLAAPGADRFKVTLTLIKDTEADSDDYFIKLVDIENGVVTRATDVSSSLGTIRQALEDYRFDESGNYMVHGGRVEIEFPEDSDEVMLVKLSPGLAYVGGKRIEWDAGMASKFKKPRLTEEFTSVNTAASIGNFVVCTSLSGIPNFDTNARVELRNNATFASGTKIGHCRIRSIEKSGNKFFVYIFEVTMLPGFNFGAAKSIGLSASNNAVIELDPTQKAEIKARENNNVFMELPFTRPDDITDITITRAFRQTGTSDASGVLTLSAGSGENFDDTGSWIVTSDDSSGVVKSPTITNSVSSATLSGLVPNTAHSILTYKQRTGTQRSKTLTGHEVVIATDASGDVTLPHTDIYALNFVTDNADSSDVIDRYTLYNGQADNFYENGKLLLGGGETAPTNVKVNYQYFAHGATGQFFGVNSYDGQVAYQNIPAHDTRKGERIELRDVLDFRPVKNNADSDYDTGIVQALPRNGDLINYDLTVYLPKIVRTGIRASTNLYEAYPGTSTLNPVLPEGVQNERDFMVIADLHLNAFLLDQDDMGIELYDNQRYTMRDIGRIQKKVDRLEEVTALSLLELDSKILEVLDSSGNNRLKAGITADPFKDHSQSDTQNVEYKASVDPVKGELRPEFYNRVTPLLYDSDRSNNTILMGDTVYVKHSEKVYIQQLNASRDVNVNPHGTPRLIGITKMSPSKDKWFEEERLPAVIVKNPNFRIDKSKTKLFGNWNFDWSGLTAGQMVKGATIGERTVTGGNRTVREGGFDVVYQKKTDQSYSISNDIGVFESQGDVVRNKITLEDMRAQFVSFKAEGLRPNTRYFPFFNNLPFDDWVNDDIGFQRRATLAKTSVFRKVGDVYKTATEYPIGGKTTLVSDANGVVEGYFFIQSNDTIKFPTGAVEFALVDVSGAKASLAKENSTSYARAIFYAEGILLQIAEEILSTRVYEIVAEEDVYEIELSRTRVPGLSPAGTPLINNQNNETGGNGDNNHTEATTTVQEAATGQTVSVEGGPGNDSKIICTAMNKAYGFGYFRNLIWVEYGRHMHPAYQVGYHAMFKPAVKYAYSAETKNTIGAKLLRWWGEGVARRRTADIWLEKRGGKRSLISSIERKILESLCYIVGIIKIKRSKGRTQ